MIRPNHDYSHIAFSTDIAGLRAMVDRAPEWRTNSSEGASLYILDPDGHRLELHVGSLATRLEDYRRAPRPGMTIFD